MPIKQVFLTLASVVLWSILQWLWGNFAYTLVWGYLRKKFSLEESTVVEAVLKHGPPFVPPLLILIIAAYMFGWVSWPFEPVSVPKPVNQLKIERFAMGDYKVGERTLISIYGRYLGNDAIRVQGRDCAFVVKTVDPDPQAMWPAQEKAWQTCIIEQSHPNSGMTFSRPFILPVRGPILTDDEVWDLSDGRAALLFMGVLRWSDGKDKFQTEYCAYTKEDRETFHSCQNHNGPVDVAR